MDESEIEKLPIFSTESESEEFFLGFQAQMGFHVECEHCGRIHFSKQYEDIAEEGVWEHLMNSYKENPDACVLDRSGIPFTIIEGKKYVLMCTCHKGRVYEDLIWSTRFQILDYLKRRAIDMQEEGDTIENETYKIGDAFEGDEDDD